MPTGLNSGNFNEGILMKRFWLFLSLVENTRNKSASFSRLDMGTRPLLRVSPLFKLWITEFLKTFKQFLVDLFMITRNDHSTNMPNFMEPNGRGNDLKIASFFSFLQNVAILKFKGHFLQEIMGKIKILLLIIIFGPQASK